MERYALINQEEEYLEKYGRGDYGWTKDIGKAHTWKSVWSAKTQSKNHKRAVAVVTIELIDSGVILELDKQ